MSTILNIETSGNACSVAVWKDGEVPFTREDTSGPNHGERLGRFVEEALMAVDGRGVTLDAVAVSSGPGSYTGLRVGVSMAKGICYGRDLPLVAVPTLELLCVPVLLQSDNMEEDALLCPMIDARRMEVYAALYDRLLRPVRGTCADIVDGGTYKAFLDAHKVYFFGSGAEKCRGVISHENAVFTGEKEALARWMGPLAEKHVAQGTFVDTAYFEPFYLKDFVAKVGRIKGL